MYGIWLTELVGDFDPESWYGFIYLITNTENNRKYVGKKAFRSRRRKKVTGRKNRKVCISDSNWREYTSSSDELNEDIAALGKEKFEFTILRLCKTKRDWTYLEVKEQFDRNVLEALLEDGTREYYNKNILSKFFANGA